MQIKKIETKEYTLSAYEMRIIRECLVYCVHRLVHHEDAGIGRALNTQGQHDLIVIKNKL